MADMVFVRDLRLRDVVRFTGLDAFGDGVVRQITDDTVTIFRPYATTADFSYTGGVIPYIGIEEVKLSVVDTRPILRIRREPVPK